MNQRTARRLQLALIACVTTSLLPAVQGQVFDLPGTVVVASGDILRTNEIVAEQLVVYGTVLADSPGTLTIHAERLVVHASGRILGYEGQRGADAQGWEAVGEHGGDGGGILVSGRSATLAGWLVAGSGGAGGAARATAVARGGDGGSGGDVRLDVADLIGIAHAVPGRGGDGGNALVVAEGPAPEAAAARGGDGGASGLVWSATQAGTDGLPVLEPTDLLPPLTSYSVDTDCPGVGARGGDAVRGKGGDGGNACSYGYGQSGSNGSPGWYGSPHGGDGESGSDAAPPPATGGAGGTGYRAGGHGGSADVAAYGGNGGGGGTAYCGHYPPNSQYYNCGNGGDGGDGGNGGAGRAQGGRGGDARCGEGGYGGYAASQGFGGYGGNGGWGTFYGNDGIPGEGWSAGADFGQPGTNLHDCKQPDQKVYAE